MAGARALWRATGMEKSDFGKPIIAIANSYTQFVPGHVHLKNLGDLVAGAVKEAGGIAREFNTIAVDDGIAMGGHSGMLYSLPSRDVIADSVEYMVNAHCADALVCISNCDKITPPGMLMAAMRLNIPVVFVSGGPMESGKPVEGVVEHRLDLVDAISLSADDSITDVQLAEIEENACPTCGSCSGMFTANSMNCLTEALGLSLPGNGTTLATHAFRKELFLRAGRTVVDLCRRYYEEDDESVLPRNIATKAAFSNAMSLDVAMGGSTNTVLHILAAAIEGEVDFGLEDIDRLSRSVPCLAKVAPNSQKFHIEDVHRAGGIPPRSSGELSRAGLLDHSVHSVHAPPDLDTWLGDWDIRSGRTTEEAEAFFHAAPRAGCAPPRRSRRPPSGRSSTTTPRAGPSALFLTPTPRTAGSACSRATSRPMARSSRPPASPRTCSTSRAPRWSATPRRRRSRRSSTRPSRPGGTSS